MSETRVVIDTNVVVSAVLLPRSVPRQAFDTAVSLGKQLVSEATVSELDEAQVQQIRFGGEAIGVPRGSRTSRRGSGRHRAITVCRDADDNKFLELAVSGRASHIVSGDDEMLAPHPFRGISILPPQDFLANALKG
jgi:predicted nucleic acid-binding protein